jgi:hypothetical protein
MRWERNQLPRFADRAKWQPSAAEQPAARHAGRLGVLGIKCARIPVTVDPKTSRWLEALRQ